MQDYGINKCREKLAVFSIIRHKDYKLYYKVCSMLVWVIESYFVTISLILNVLVIYNTAFDFFPFVSSTIY